MGICFSTEESILMTNPVGAGTSELKTSPTEPELSDKLRSSGSGSVSSAPRNVKDLQQSPVNFNVDIFTYEEMRLATKHFRPDLIIGEGGFGVVYKGVIDDSVRQGYRTTKVAIKELNPEGFQGDREWLAEVIYLGQLSHPNLVKLIGYCCEDEHRLLVYEFMAGGSLEKNLFRRVGCTLTWPRRIKIALGVARGLAFLHGAERSIIYRDFKPSNILLDEEFNPRLSDFGLAKEGPVGDQTHVSTRVMGTYGYAAPEYVMTGHLTARSDVYGFGVVLLEMLIGRGAMEKNRPSREHNLVEWARPLLNNNKKLPRILDPRIDGQYSLRNVMKVAYLAYVCLSSNPKGRPHMSEVVEILESLKIKEARTEAAMLESGCGSVTLFEAAPKDSSPKRKEEARRQRRNSDAHHSRPSNESSATDDSPGRKETSRQRRNSDVPKSPRSNESDPSDGVESK